MIKTKTKVFRSVAEILQLGLAIAFLSGCATTMSPPTQTTEDDIKDLLTQFARQAVNARQQLAASKLNAEQIKRADPRGGNAAFDVDYIGPIGSIVEAVATKAGWKYKVLGPKRDDIIVTMYHVRVPPVVILQDAGEQCNGRCNVNVEIIPNGTSEVTLTYR